MTKSIAFVESANLKKNALLAIKFFDNLQKNVGRTWRGSSYGSKKKMIEILLPGSPSNRQKFQA
jgi:hypothetical protein